MKKHSILLASAGAIMMSLLGSCHKDSETLPTLGDKTYTDTELDAEYNGTQLTGKYAILSGGDSKPVLTLGSMVNFGQFSQSLAQIPTVPGPGVLPGTPVLSLPLTLTPDGNHYSFSGSGETDFVTYSYSGEITDQKVDIDFQNVKLKEQGLANTAWKPAPIGINTPGQGFSSLPFHIVWKADLPGLEAAIDGDIQDLMQIISTLPLIPVSNGTAYMSPAQTIISMFPAIGLNADGNLVVTYLQTNNGAAQFAQAPKCMIQYLPVGNSQVKLYVNPLDLMGQIIMNTSSHPELPPHPFGKAATRAGLMDSPAVASALQYLLPMLSQGFPATVSVQGGKLALYLDNTQLTPLMQKVIVPIMTDPTIQAMVMQKLGENPQLATYLPKMKKLFELLPQLVAATTEVQLGLNFIPYK